MVFKNVTTNFKKELFQQFPNRFLRRDGRDKTSDQADLTRVLL